MTSSIIPLKHDEIINQAFNFKTKKAIYAKRKIYRNINRT